MSVGSGDLRRLRCSGPLGAGQLVVNYSRMKLTLKPEGLAVRLRGKMVEIYDFPDGRLSLER